MVKAKDILEEISGYDISIENAKDMLLSGDRSDFARFYFRNMLLQLIKIEPLYRIYALYHDFEYGSLNFNKIIKIKKDGAIQEISMPDIYINRKKKFCGFFEENTFRRY